MVTMSNLCSLQTSLISGDFKTSCDHDHAHLRDKFVTPGLIFHVANQCTKFEVSTFTSKKELKQCKMLKLGCFGGCGG